MHAVLRYTGFVRHTRFTMRIPGIMRIHTIPCGASLVLLALLLSGCGGETADAISVNEPSAPAVPVPAVPAPPATAPDPMPAPVPSPTPPALGSIAIAVASASASTSDSRCDCVAAKVLDQDLTTRWSANGDGVNLTLDLGTTYQVESVEIAWHRGNERMAIFDLLVADQMSGPWTVAAQNMTSSGTSVDFESYPLDAAGRYLRLVGHGNSLGDGWTSVLEVRAHGRAVHRAAAPVFSPAAGQYSPSVSVSIASEDAGTQIRYTTDGSDPTASSGLLYAGPVLLTQTTTLKSIAYRNGVADSMIATAAYVISAGGGGGPAPWGNLDPAAPPSRNFDLSKWKLTIPSGTDINPATLNNGYILPGAFFTDPVSGGMVFRCPNIAGTTANSSYSRSELREMLNEGSGTTSLGNNWVLGTSSAAARSAAGGVDGTMKVSLRVDHVSTTGDAAKVGRVIVGQIHGPDSEVIRLYFHKLPSDAKGAIYFAHDTPAGQNSYHAIIGDPGHLDPVNGIALGERWDYEIIVRGRTLTVNVIRGNGTVTSSSLQVEAGYDDQYLYYKAGVYNQNNTGDSGDFVQATFFSISHVHP
jgi:poly(beta-D-mannuronate) lyase